MMVAAITNLDDTTIWERYPLACGRQACALWWQKPSDKLGYTTLRPGGTRGRGIDAVI